MKCRVGESEQRWYRFDRFFSTREGWFFSTREGENIGPFVSRNVAEKAVRLYIKYASNESGSGSYGARLAKHGFWASTLLQ